MADEQEAIASAELETPAIETVATPAPEPTPDESIDLEAAAHEEAAAVEEPGEAPAETIETVEIEWDDGNKYTIPKALEAGILKNKDYTTKAQKVAADRKALESRQAEIEERLKVTEEELDVRADLRTVSKTLEEFSKLTQTDWDAHQMEDPLATERAWRQYQMLKEQKTELEARLGKAKTERTGKAEQELANRVQETLEFAKKSIPGFKPDTISTLVEFAAQNGIPEDAIKANWSPTFLKLLHRAHLGEQLIKKQSTAPKLPNAQASAPLKTVTGKSTPAARGDLASIDDMSAYIAARKSGVGGKSPF